MIWGQSTGISNQHVGNIGSELLTTNLQQITQDSPQQRFSSHTESDMRKAEQAIDNCATSECRTNTYQEYKQRSEDNLTTTAEACPQGGADPVVKPLCKNKRKHFDFQKWVYDTDGPVIDELKALHQQNLDHNAAIGQSVAEEQITQIAEYFGLSTEQAKGPWRLQVVWRCWQWRRRGKGNGKWGVMRKQPSNSTQSWRHANRIDVNQRTADDVNKNDFNNGYKPPYKPLRLLSSQWNRMTNLFVFMGKITLPVLGWCGRSGWRFNCEQIQRKYSLPSKPQFISDVDVPAGTRMRTVKLKPILNCKVVAEVVLHNMVVKYENYQQQFPILEEINESTFSGLFFMLTIIKFCWNTTYMAWLNLMI